MVYKAVTRVYDFYMTETMITYPATPKQIAFLKKLAAERPMWADVENMHADNIERLTKQQASSFIDQALQVPKETKTSSSKSKATGLAIQSDGMYRTPDGTVFRVQVAKQGSGNLYAKRLIVTFDEAKKKFVGHFQYASGAVYSLKPDDKMTLAEAKSYGQLYNLCCVCGADLTDETSIAEGIGPVCGGRVKSKKVWFDA